MHYFTLISKILLLPFLSILLVKIIIYPWLIIGRRINEKKLRQEKPPNYNRLRLLFISNYSIVIYFYCIVGACYKELYNVYSLLLNSNWQINLITFLGMLFWYNVVVAVSKNFNNVHPSQNNADILVYGTESYEIMLKRNVFSWTDYTTITFVVLIFFNNLIPILFLGIPEFFANLFLMK